MELSGESEPCQLLLLSAKTSAALEAATANLARYFKDHPECNLADAAYTLSVGRRSFDHRRVLVCRDLNDAVTALETLDPRRVITRSQERRNTPVVFMFPGQGSQYVNMGRELYHGEPVFRQELDRCAALLEPHLGYDLLQVLYPDEGRMEEATVRLTQTAVAQPAIFAIEYALAKLWIEWGIRPEVMIGHSIGEFVAACLAGVFSLKDALALVAARGRLIQALPAGAMLAVPLAEKEVSQLLGKDLALAAINGPSNCVVSGPTEAVDTLERQLAKREIAARHLHTSHAFHSAMIDPILGKFMEEVRKIKLNPPEIPFISSLTGNWITPEEATEPSYWVQSDAPESSVFGRSGSAVRGASSCTAGSWSGANAQYLCKTSSSSTCGACRAAYLETSARGNLGRGIPPEQLGRLWLAGAEVNWSGLYAGERRHRIPLPTYPFEGKRFWIDPPALSQQPTASSKAFEESFTSAVGATLDENVDSPLEGGAGGCPPRHPNDTLQQDTLRSPMAAAPVNGGFSQEPSMSLAGTVRNERRVILPWKGVQGDVPRHSDATLQPDTPRSPMAATPGGFTEVMPAPQLSAVPPPAPSRKQRILAELINITHNLSGIEAADLDVNATFLELGFDSLFLTQANAEFRKKFNVKITFRQLLQEAPTLDALAQFVDNNLPPEAFPEERSQLDRRAQAADVRSSARQHTDGALIPCAGAGLCCRLRPS